MTNPVTSGDTPITSYISLAILIPLPMRFELSNKASASAYDNIITLLSSSPDYKFYLPYIYMLIIKTIYKTISFFIKISITDIEKDKSLPIPCGISTLLIPSYFINHQYHFHKNILPNMISWMFPVHNIKYIY